MLIWLTKYFDVEPGNTLVPRAPDAYRRGRSRNISNNQPGSLYLFSIRLSVEYIGAAQVAVIPPTHRISFTLKYQWTISCHINADRPTYIIL